MGLRIELDPGKCSGLGLCEAEAPELFEVQDDGSLTVLDERPSTDRRAECEAAVASCPTEALRLLED
ncbi:ferredoxin [Pseudonocardia pini]|uniref:ferredoxin n=1 Tax=Pseudonocardia pini TaxID=2758030 RepID=UPI0015F0BBA3